jgi:hypothetical protein
VKITNANEANAIMVLALTAAWVVCIIVCFLKGKPWSAILGVAAAVADAFGRGFLQAAQQGDGGVSFLLFALQQLMPPNPRGQPTGLCALRPRHIMKTR